MAMEVLAAWVSLQGKGWDGIEKLFQIEAMNQLVKSPHTTVIVFRWEGGHIR